MASDAVVLPFTVIEDGFSEQLKFPEAKQFSETIALPPLGPPRSSGSEVLCPDFTITRDELDDSVKSVKVTVRGTGALLEGAKSRPPMYSATICREPEGIAVAGTVTDPELVRRPVVEFEFMPMLAKFVPLADKFTNPPGCGTVEVSVTEKVTEPELSTLAGVTDSVVVVATAMAAKVRGSGLEATAVQLLSPAYEAFKV